MYVKVSKTLEKYVSINTTQKYTKDNYIECLLIYSV